MDLVIHQFQVINKVTPISSAAFPSALRSFLGVGSTFWGHSVSSSRIHSFTEEWIIYSMPIVFQALHPEVGDSSEQDKSLHSLEEGHTTTT